MTIILDGTTGITTPAINSSGDLELPGGTANGVLYLNGSKVATSGSALVFDGANLGVGVTPSAWSTAYKAFQLDGNAALSAFTTGIGQTNLSHNLYREASNWKFLGNDAASLYAQTSGIHYWYNTASGTAGGNATLIQAMTLTEAGNLGIGVTSVVDPTRTAIQVANASFGGGLYLNTSTTDTENARVVSDSSGGLYLATATTGTNLIAFYTSNAERARITSGGEFLIGTTTTSVATEQGIVLSSGTFFANSSTTTAGDSLILLYSSFSTADQTKFEVTSEGNVKSRTNSYAGFSDERLKQNIKPSSSQWDAIKDIEVVKFQFKSEQFSEKENPWMLGVVAQQVEKTSPGLVSVDPKDGMKTVKYSILYMKAVKALQEAMTRIENLEAEVSALKGV